MIAARIFPFLALFLLRGVCVTQVLSESLWTVARAMRSLGRKAEAAPQFAKAFRLLSKNDWLMAEEPKRLERLRTLAGNALETD